MNKKAVKTKDLFNVEVPFLKDFFDQYEYPIIICLSIH